jgi:hypothetical protein
MRHSSCVRGLLLVLLPLLPDVAAVLSLATLTADGESHDDSQLLQHQQEQHEEILHHDKPKQLLVIAKETTKATAPDQQNQQQQQPQQLQHDLQQEQQHEDNMTVAVAGATDLQDALRFSDSQVVMDVHTKLRALHRSGALAWRNSLAQQAADWVIRCDFVTDPDAAAGEIIYASLGSVSDSKTLLTNIVYYW